MSPTLRVPLRTSREVTVPFSLSRRPSRTKPSAVRLGLAFSSSISAWSWIISSRLSIFMFCLADTGTKMVSPPHSSEISPYSVSCCITRLGSAPSLSILLTATMIGTLAALAWLMDSMVCGMTPSSAATTRMAMSVMLAPLALMEVKAAWPGVSMKVIFLPWWLTW